MRCFAWTSSPWVSSSFCLRASTFALRASNTGLSLPSAASRIFATARTSSTWTSLTFFCALMTSWWSREGLEEGAIAVMSGT